MRFSKSEIIVEKEQHPHVLLKDMVQAIVRTVQEYRAKIETYYGRMGHIMSLLSTQEEMAKFPAAGLIKSTINAPRICPTPLCFRNLGKSNLVEHFRNSHPSMNEQSITLFTDQPGMKSTRSTYICNLCNFQTKWMSSHLKKRHGINVTKGNCRKFSDEYVSILLICF